MFGDIRSRRQHSYYSWASLLLILQGLMFYLPHWIWHAFEGKKVASIVQDTSNRMFEKENRHLCVENVALYLRRSRGQHQVYFFLYVACEALNFANVLGNLFFIDAYLGGGFLSYGVRVLSQGGAEDQPSPMAEQFPKLTACRVTLPGRGGVTHSTDAACVLTLNALYEKTYLLLWFWLVCLAAVSGCSLVCRLVTMPSSRLRASALGRRAPLADPADLSELAEVLGLGDMFVLSLIAENVDSGAFQRLAAELASTLTGRRTIEEETVRPAGVTDGGGLFKRPDSSVAPAK